MHPGKMGTAQQQAMAVQARIRRDAMEQNDFLTDMGKWEKDIKKTDRTLTRRAQRLGGGAPPVRSSGGAVSVRSMGKKIVSKTKSKTKVKSKTRNEPKTAPVQAAVDTQQQGKLKAKSAHVYDKGYKKWESFDVDKALEDIDNDAEGTGACTNGDNEDGGGEEEEVEEEDEEEEVSLHPALLRAPAKVVDRLKSRRGDGRPVARTIPAAASATEREKLEREAGNSCFRDGNFHEAAKHYTRVISINPANVLALSNRAMAYLKLKEHSKAERDCCAALRIDGTHVKSLSRRAAAYNATGRHHAALFDLQRALELEPSSKSVRVEHRKTVDRLRSAIRAAPRVPVHVREVGADEARGQVAGPVPARQASTTTAPAPTAPAQPPRKQRESVQQQDREGKGHEDRQSIETVNADGAQSAGADINTSSSESSKHREQQRMKAQKSKSAKVKKPSAVRAGFLSKGRGATTRAGSRSGEAAASLSAPKTAYEFQRVWQSLEASRRTEYTSLLNASQLPKMLGDALDDSLLVGLVVAAGGLEPAPAARLLGALTKGRRFDMVSMMLAAPEKRQVAAVFDSLSTAVVDGAVDGGELAATRARFGV
eukprot:g1332.t1